MQSPKTIQIIDISQAKSLEDLREKFKSQIEIIEKVYRQLHNDIAKLREDMTGYHP